MKVTHQTILTSVALAVAGHQPAVAQLPAGYSRDSTVILPDTLHEVILGGRFRISIVRHAESARERELLSIAESLIPPTDSIEASASRMEGAGWVQGFADARLRTGPRWWWREWDGVWLPFALTGEAVAEYVARVRSLSVSPNPFARYEAGVAHRASVEYTASVRALPDAQGHQAELSVRFEFYCGRRCALTFTHKRVVTFDDLGGVLRVEGDGQPFMMVS